MLESWDWGTSNILGVSSISRENEDWEGLSRGPAVGDSGTSGFPGVSTIFRELGNFIFLLENWSWSSEEEPGEKS